MHRKIVWEIVPLGLPKVIKNCSKCGSKCEFVCSGNFRVNANQNNLDVWLIYQCKKCKTTWNMEILSRIGVRSIDKELYQKYLRNDYSLAEKYAFDTAVHARNKSVPVYDDIPYQITGESLILDSIEEEILVELKCEPLLEIRLDKILCRQLGISRDAVKILGKNGIIKGSAVKDIAKAKLKDGMTITIRRP